MFDLGWSELLLVAAVALLVIGPKELPLAMRALGKWVGKARAMTRHVRAGFDEMVRQAELEEMEKEWKRHNEAIMAATGPVPDLGTLPGHAPPAPAGCEPDHAGEPPRVDLGKADANPPDAGPQPGPEAAR
ncbi:Sec-independent protein translocase protein TatB [Thermaurantiacus sp.]